MTPSGKRRPARVAALVQETLAAAIQTELKDPRVGFVTVTGVDVSADLAHATVRVSVLGDDEEKARALAGLASAAGFLRTQLAQALALRVAPELHFQLDRGLEHAARIDRILDQLKHGDGS